MARDGKKREGESREGRHWLEKGWGGLHACSLGALASAIHISSKFFIYFTGSWIIFSLPKPQFYFQRVVPWDHKKW